MRCIGFTATAYEGKRYVKVNTLSEIEEGRGKGETIAVISVDVSQEQKLQAAIFPCQLDIIEQVIRMKKGAAGQQIPELVIARLEIKPGIKVG